MSRKEFAVHVLAGLVAITAMCWGVWALANRKPGAACVPVEGGAS